MKQIFQKILSNALKMKKILVLMIFIYLLQEMKIIKNIYSL